jgi:hypothetical protein
MPALRIHTHCQVAQKCQRTNQNLSKSMATQTHGKIANPKTKISARIERNCLKVNKAQHTTRYIKHLAESANFKCSTFNKLSNGLIGNHFELPNVSYTNPLAAMEYISNLAMWHETQIITDLAERKLNRLGPNIRTVMFVLPVI